jgi:hypothetical protein
MDCRVTKKGTQDDQASYRIRWRAAGDIRVDMDSTEGTQTLWISNGTISIASPGEDDVRSMSIKIMAPGPMWQPALEFLSPEILEENLERHYGLMQNVGRVDSGENEFLIHGRDEQHDIEITVNSNTYLPDVLKIFRNDSNPENRTQKFTMEARFLWNYPMPEELFIPQIPVTDQ